MAKDTVSYDSPFYADLASSTEQKLGLPVGLLSSIVTKGERSNADQTSEAGAKTVFQIIPATRKAALEKYGVDAYLSPENAAEVAGRLLKDSLSRNNGDAKEAVGEYIGGTDRKNWGKTTQAYINRVMTGQQSKKVDALSAGFAQFMADNPAQGKPSPTQATELAKDDPLSAGFGQWLKMGAPQTAADMIPRDDGTFAPSQVTPDAETSLVDKVIGSGETALSLASGATTGTLGMLGGTAKGLAQSVMDGSFGTAQGANAIEQAAGEGMEAGTYAPRTQSGQNQTSAVGEAMMAALPVTALTTELGAAGQAARGAAAAARDLSAGAVARVSNAASSAAERLRETSPAIASRVQRILNRNPEPTPASRGSVGAAATGDAQMRNALAESLPVPIELTAGEATRDPLQIRNENEWGKQEVGQGLRDRVVENNKKIEQNFDNYIDRTEAATTDLTEVGRSATTALRKEAARDKAEIRVAYTDAEKSAEGVAPVKLNSVIDFLNENRPDEAVSPVLKAARGRAVQLGIAAEDSDGILIPTDTTIKNAERFRRAIGNATDYDATNIRNSAAMKGLIDSETEAAAGPLYRNARRLRENYAKKYENRAIVSDLLTNKKGSSDRKVALENVFQESILKGDREDLSYLRSALQTSGAEGAQAWKDLQGATAQWLKDQAFFNSAKDSAGNTVASYASLKKAIDKLEKGKRLDFIFTPKGAQQIRDLAEVVSYVKTAPPGFINSANTTSVLLAAMAEAGAAGALTGVPLPVLSLLRALAKQHKNRALQKRIEQALTQGRSRQRPQP